MPRVKLSAKDKLKKWCEEKGENGATFEIPQRLLSMRWGYDGSYISKMTKELLEGGKIHRTHKGGFGKGASRYRLGPMPDSPENLTAEQLSEFLFGNEDPALERKTGGD